MYVYIHLYHTNDIQVLGVNRDTVLANSIQNCHSLYMPRLREKIKAA